MTNKELQKLKVITQKIVKNYAPEKIILFGSYALIYKNIRKHRAREFKEKIPRPFFSLN